MPALVNQTTLPAETLALLDQHASQFLLIVVCATFGAPPGGPVRLAEEQLPLWEVDEYRGEPGASGVVHEGDFVLEKPHVDVTLNGRAFAPNGRKVERLRVGLRVGPLKKELQVTGNRFWRQGLLGGTPTSPEPFETMPIVYERAYGGIDLRSTDPSKQVSEPRNPIGVGFRGAPPRNPEIGTELPNIEYPSQLMTSPKSHPEPAGFGAVSKNCRPRIGFAGTYDAGWLAEQWPLLPADFDPRFFQSAPPDQQSDEIRGGEPVEVTNMTPEGSWEFVLPTLDIPVRLAFGDREETAKLRLDTVELEPDEYRFKLTARVKVPIVRNRSPLRVVVLG
ncbi:MAG: DUF2169 domain-containing protein, partial [Planctomycetia bacterium]|nr:DUF2169 domain-containing protein [Planctomycetia bacterium]